MKKLIPFLALMAFLWSCDTATESQAGDEGQDVVEITTADNATHEKSEEVEEASFPDPDATGNFGAAVSAEGAIDVSQLPAQLNETDSVRVKLAGTVKAACQAKGCWMTLALDEDDELMVKFKDYAFFVPKNSGGKHTVIEGWAFREVVSVDELRHYAEDEGLPKEEVEKITEPKERLTFMADGVIIEE